jgi:hypothetical protein
VRFRRAASRPPPFVGRQKPAHPGTRDHPCDYPDDACDDIVVPDAGEVREIPRLPDHHSGDRRHPAAQRAGVAAVAVEPLVNQAAPTMAVFQTSNAAITRHGFDLIRGPIASPMFAVGIRLNATMGCTSKLPLVSSVCFRCVRGQILAAIRSSSPATLRMCDAAGRKLRMVTGHKSLVEPPQAGILTG